MISSFYFISKFLNYSLSFFKYWFSYYNKQICLSKFSSTLIFFCSSNIKSVDLYSCNSFSSYFWTSLSCSHCFLNLSLSSVEYLFFWSLNSSLEISYIFSISKIWSLSLSFSLSSPHSCFFLVKSCSIYCSWKAVFFYTISASRYFLQLMWSVAYLVS